MATIGKVEGQDKRRPLKQLIYSSGWQNPAGKSKNALKIFTDYTNKKQHNAAL